MNVYSYEILQRIELVLIECLETILYMLFMLSFIILTTTLYPHFTNEVALREMKQFAQCHTALGKWQDWELNVVLWLTIMYSISLQGKRYFLEKVLKSTMCRRWHGQVS